MSLPRLFPKGKKPGAERKGAGVAPAQGGLPFQRCLAPSLRRRRRDVFARCCRSTTSQSMSSRPAWLPPSSCRRCVPQIEPGPAADASLRLARKLVERGWLTSYQAKKLLSGATRGFFLGGYRLMRPIGEGGMGKVFLAINDRKEQVAIKVLPPRKAAEEDNALQRFRREMELSRRCSHPNLARTKAVGSEGDVHFMVMEYIPGKSLFDLVRNEGNGPLRVPDAARLFLKVVDGLAAGAPGGAGASRHQAVKHHDHADGRGQAAGPGACPGS